VGIHPPTLEAVNICIFWAFATRYLVILHVTKLSMITDFEPVLTFIYLVSLNLSTLIKAAAQIGNGESPVRILGTFQCTHYEVTQPHRPGGHYLTM
jgi:hypothetical protein